MTDCLRCSNCDRWLVVTCSVCGERGIDGERLAEALAEAHRLLSFLEYDSSGVPTAFPTEDLVRYFLAKLEAS